MHGEPFMNTKTTDRDAALGLTENITRRDFIGGVLAGAGAALVSVPSLAGAQTLDSSWTGYGGVGDYALSNGNTANVVNAAHGVRDALYEDKLRNAEVVDDIHDLVVVGSGFAGMAATLEFLDSRPRGNCLILENHPVFGGEAKQNEFDVDGIRLRAPQGSSDFTMPPRGIAAEYWSRLGLPFHFDFAAASGTRSDMRIPKDNFTASLHWRDRIASIGYYFDRATYGSRSGWVREMWDDRLERTPFSEAERRELLILRHEVARPERLEDDRWLDTMSYADFLRTQLGVGDTARRYVDPMLATVDFAASSDVISAYAAKRLLMPGTLPDYDRRLAGLEIMSFPGGNATLLRHFVKAVMPRAISGSNTFADITCGSIRFDQLDKSDERVRMRVGATVVSMEHEGSPEDASLVWVTYVKDGRMYKVRARSAVVAIGGWIAKRIVRDLPEAHRHAFAQFHHGPILVANVAVRHWRYLDELGISAARWFNGFGFYCNLRTPMLVGTADAPFGPDKPTVLTFYVGFPTPGMPLAAQTASARARMFATSYVEYERQIRAQMQEMFGGYGFDARRDIAGIVLNRWGHAYICPPPGFHFGTAGNPSPLETVRKGYGRVAFGHSEHTGRQAWVNAVSEGRRAAKQVLGQS